MSLITVTRSPRRPRVAELLEKSGAYAGQVTLQVDDEISLASYQGWAEYDLITVFSHSGVKCAGDDCGLDEQLAPG